MSTTANPFNFPALSVTYALDRFSSLNLEDTDSVTWNIDEFGNLSATSTGGTGAPGGDNTQIQYNDSGQFGGITGATTDGTNLSVTTQSPGDDSTKAASTAYVDSAVAGISNIQIVLPTDAIDANSATDAATVSMPGLLTTSTFSVAFTTDPTSVTGWGTTGGLTLVLWPTSDTLNWRVINQTSSSITPGSITVNIGAK